MSAVILYKIQLKNIDKMFTTNNIYNSSQHKIANSDVQDGLTG